MNEEQMNNEDKPKKKHPVLKAILIILLVIIVLIGIGAIYLFTRYKKYTIELEEAQKGVIGTEAPEISRPKTASPRSNSLGAWAAFQRSTFARPKTGTL